MEIFGVLTSRASQFLRRGAAVGLNGRQHLESISIWIEGTHRK